MEILKGIEISGLSLFLKKEKTLIFSDTHIGKEESLRKQGLMIPIDHFKDLFNETKSILEKNKPKTIIINGDLKDSFGQSTIDEWDKILKYLRMIQKYGELRLIQGNHDKSIKPIADKLNIKLEQYIKIKDIYICHGDKIPEDSDFKKAKTIIIGHEHPAVKLIDGQRTEIYKCFLKGKFKGKNLIITPSMHKLSYGTDIISEKPWSPFLTMKSRDKFKVFVVGDEIYDFGTVKNLKEL